MMTPQLTQDELAALGAPDLVYVRPVKASELLADTQVQVMEGIKLEPDQVLYAVHRADGERIAVMTDRDAAVAAARANEMAPVSVH